jgi:hypothetical protein
MNADKRILSIKWFGMDVTDFVAIGVYSRTFFLNSVALTPILNALFGADDKPALRDASTSSGPAAGSLFADDWLSVVSTIFIPKSDAPIAGQ